MRSLSEFALLLRIALRSLLARRSTLLVGGFLAFCAAFLTVVTGIRQSFESAARESMARTFVGHVHVFSAKTEGELQLFPTSGGTRFHPLPELERWQDLLEGDPNVAAVAPMGRLAASVSWGNPVDRVLERLRTEYRPGEALSQEAQGRVEKLIQHVRFLAAGLVKDLETEEALLASPEAAGELALARRVGTDAFWDEFRARPLEGLELLENRFAPLTPPQSSWTPRVIGLQPETLARVFPNVEFVDGGPIPPGGEGLLLSRYNYEAELKLRTARLLDLIHEARSEGRTLAKDSELQEWRARAQARAEDFLLLLDEDRARALAARLSTALEVPAGDLPSLLGRLLAVDDANFDARYRLFYAELPRYVDLYWARIGERIPLRARAASGYERSVNVTLRGTYKLKGLPYQAQPAADFDLIDLGTLSTLYGFPTEAESSEVKALSRELEQFAGARDRVESMLFSDEPGREAPASRIDEGALLTAPSAVERGAPRALGLAVLLKDGRALDETLERLRERMRAQGAALVAVPWTTASGDDGTLATALSAILRIAAWVLFAVAGTVIVCVTVVVSARRRGEVGTYRAMGASRAFVSVLVLTEALIVGLSFGAAGCVAGSFLLRALHEGGIPVGSQLAGLIGDTALRPVLEPGAPLAALATVVAMAAIAYAFPAWSASRVPPVQAMQSEL